MLNYYEHETLSFVYREYAMLNTSELDVSTERQVEGNLLAQYVDKIVQQLSPACRRVFVMSKQQDMSNRKIAEQLGISESTVEKHLAKATQFVRHQLSLYYDQIFIFLFFFWMQ